MYFVLIGKDKRLNLKQEREYLVGTDWVYGSQSRLFTDICLLSVLSLFFPLSLGCEYKTGTSWIVVTASVWAVLAWWAFGLGFHYHSNHEHRDRNSKLVKGGRRFWVFLLLDEMSLNAQSVTYKEGAPWIQDFSHAVYFSDSWHLSLCPNDWYIKNDFFLN